jgi:hypothetical protein
MDVANPGAVEIIMERNPFILYFPSRYSTMITHHVITALATLAAVLHAAPPADRSADVVTIITSGETHAMLDPCDCPQEPGGGLAERATVLKAQHSAGQILLLDAGGFAGGGIYDSYTAGRAADSLRTIAAIDAMGTMRYDAAVVGDDDLQYGAVWLAQRADAAGLPLISANCLASGNKRFVPAWRIFVKNGIRFGIAGLTSPDRLSGSDGSIIVQPPLQALKKIWKELQSASDYQVVLSHLGEEAIAAIVDSFPDVDLIVNGHRKSAQYPAKMIGRTVVMQFGFQGKKLARTDLRCTSGGRANLIFEKSDWIPVARETPPDSSVAALLASGPKLEEKSVYDLYIMSQCSYGRAALREFIDFARRVPDEEWNLWFIGDVRGDSLHSLHGREEVDDEMVWLAVRSLYPKQWPDFLEAMCPENAATFMAIRSLKLDSASIKKWVSRKGRAVLAEHYRRSMRLAVTASPTLLINNAPFDKAVTDGRLSKGYCAGRMQRPAWCDTLPQCFDDGDCAKKGFIGSCSQKGACSYAPDQAFVFSVLVADSTLYHPERAIIATTEELFPNVTVVTVASGSAKGGDMLKRYAPAALPFYIFGNEAPRAHNFSRIESGLRRLRDGYAFKNGITPCNYFLLRNRLPRRIEAFIDPVFPEAMAVAVALMADSSLAARTRVAPVFYSDPAADAPTLDEKVRREESLRWLVLDSLYNKSFAAYIAHYAKNPGSSESWFASLGVAGIDPKEFANRQQAAAGALASHWRFISSLSLKDPVGLLIGNRELIPLRNQGELQDVLEYLKQ